MTQTYTLDGLQNEEDKDFEDEKHHLSASEIDVAQALGPHFQPLYRDLS